MFVVVVIRDSRSMLFTKRVRRSRKHVLRELVCRVACVFMCAYMYVYVCVCVDHAELRLIATVFFLFSFKISVRRITPF